MKNQRQAFAIALAVFMLSTSTSHADTIVMTNGDRASGTVVAVAGGRVAFATELFGTLDVALDDVASLTTDAPVNVKVGGDNVTGQLASTGSAVEIVDANGARTDIALSDIASISVPNDTSAAAADSSWVSTADLSIVITNGNSDTQSASVRTNSVYAHGPYEHQLTIAVDQEEAEEETTRDQYDIGYDFRYFFRDAWYAAANVGYFSDKIKEVDRRVTVGAAIGHRVWDNSLGALSLELGASQVFESLDGESDSNPAARWALQYNRWLQPERFELFHNHELLKIIGSDRGEVLTSSTGLRMHISDTWNANIRTDVQHETKPQPGNGKTDVTYAIGVGITF
ncbi:MAG: DUF481 domain-containing protein [Pseudomonadaceae bacterium]|nr:DUF481 domain-containing protein [Pseudomonadaceae bacterium]